MKTALLFPGQASQYVGMGADLCAAFPAAKAMYETAAGILGFDVARLSFEGPADELVQTVHTQPAIFVHSCIMHHLASERGLTFEVAAGHSLGEYSALVAAGVVSFEDGLTAVRDRARFMQEACEANPGTMAAILGLDYDTVTEVCRQAAEQDEIVVAANYNGAAQVVVSGSRAGVEAASQRAKEAGAKRAIPLSVGGAFHSPLMEPSPERLKPVLEGLDFRSGSKPVVLNVTAQPVTDPGEIRARLIDQLTAPVLWYPTLQWMRDAAIDRLVEVGPKKVLLGLAKTILREAEMVSLDTAADLEALASSPVPLEQS
jgi:[acyl-carrier-protein] S-malonyltransferase